MLPSSNPEHVPLKNATIFNSTTTMTRVAIVTGAAQGLGRAISLRLAKDGVEVAVNDIHAKQQALEDLVKEIVTIGRKSIAIVGDVTKESEVKAMVVTTVEKLGGLDIMVANAGIHQAHSILDVPDDAFDRIISVNCKGVLYCYRAAAVQMIKQGRGGRIIGASSVWGLTGGAGSVSYVASKFAVRGITQTAAMEWAQYNITVNAYAPSFIDTPMVSALVEAGLPGTAEVVKTASLLNRVGKPEEVAAVVSFLASEDSSFVTGQAYGVNGGMLMS